MRILVTGASGFCGSTVAQGLADKGFEVVAVYRRRTRFLDRVESDQRIHFVQADLVDARSLPGPFDGIVHAAATSPRVGVSAGQIVRDNIDASFALIDAALAWRSRYFIFFSSMSIYGEFLAPVVDETTPIHNPDVYGATKYLAEQRLAELGNTLSSLALRLPGVVGWGAHDVWLATTAARLRSGETIRAFHLDRPFNNAVHTGDLTAFICSLLARPGEGCDKVVLGARGIVTVRGAVERLARGLGVDARIESAEPTKASFILSCDRAIARYGYDPMEVGTIIDRYAADLGQEAEP